MEMFRIIINVFVFLMFAACLQENTQTTGKTFQATDDIEGIRIGYKDFKLIGKLKKLNKFNPDDGNLETNECRDWEFQDSSLTDIISTMRIVPPEEWYARCYFISCWFEGIVRNEHTEYELTVSATSYIILDNEEETLHFILDSPSDLFLMPCNCCEE